MPHLNIIKQAIERAGERQRPLPLVLDFHIRQLHIPAWLSILNDYPRFYWRDRGGESEIGASGAAFSFNAAGDQTALTEACRLFDAGDADYNFSHIRRFAPYAGPGDDTWRGFPGELCYLPKAMIRRRGESYTFSTGFTINHTDDARDILQQALAMLKEAQNIEAKAADSEAFDLTALGSTPGYSGWEAMILDALKRIGSEQLRKVVLAGRTDYGAADMPDAMALLQHLAGFNPGCFAILMEPEPGLAFLSLSPERLYRRVGRRLEIDALSSTVIRGENEAEDAQLARYLLHSDKEQREHRFVIEGIIESIGMLCSGEPEIGETSIRRLERIQHLWTPISATLHDTVGDDQIIACLHPTPAVGGMPRTAALQCITELEPFDRGWYAAPVGMVCRDAAEFAVGIRSLVMRGNKLSVFTGAGIVRGSEPQAEWREINNKNILGPLLSGYQYS